MKAIVHCQPVFRVGTRKTIEVTPEDSMAEAKATRIYFVAVGQDAWVYRYHTTLASLVAKKPFK